MQVRAQMTQTLIRRRAQPLRTLRRTQL